MKTSHKERVYARQNWVVPETDEVIKSRLLDEFSLPKITKELWAEIQDNIDRYHAKKDEGWDNSNDQQAWASLLNEMEPIVRTILSYSNKQPTVPPSGSADSAVIFPTGVSHVFEDKSEDKSDVKKEGSAECLPQNYLSFNEVVRTRALTHYLLSKCIEQASDWRREYTHGRSIHPSEVLKLLGSPALALFRMAQLRDWGVDILHHSAVISKTIEDMDNGLCRAEVDFLSDGKTHEAIFTRRELRDFIAEGPMYRDFRGNVGKLQALPGSALDSIRLMSERMAENYGWRPMQAVRLLLADQSPCIHRIESIDIAYDPVLVRMPTEEQPLGQRFIQNTITVKVPYFLSPDTVAKIFRHAQQAFVAPRELPRNSQSPRKDKKPHERRVKAFSDNRTPVLFRFMIENNLTDGKLPTLPTKDRRRMAEKWNKSWAERTPEEGAREINEMEQSEDGDVVLPSDFHPGGVWIIPREEWQFKDKKGKTNTSRFVEACERAEAIMLNLPGKSIRDAEKRNTRHIGTTVRNSYLTDMVDADGRL